MINPHEHISLDAIFFIHSGILQSAEAVEKGIKLEMLGKGRKPVHLRSVPCYVVPCHMTEQ